MVKVEYFSPQFLKHEVWKGDAVKVGHYSSESFKHEAWKVVYGVLLESCSEGKRANLTMSWGLRASSSTCIECYL